MRRAQAQHRGLWEERERAVLPYNRPSIEPPLRRTLNSVDGVSSIIIYWTQFFYSSRWFPADDYPDVWSSSAACFTYLVFYRPSPTRIVTYERSSPWTAQLSHQSLSSTGLTSETYWPDKSVFVSYLVVLRDRLLRRNTPFVILLATLSDDVDISILTVKHLCFMLNSVKT